MIEFDHVGLTSTANETNEMWVESTRCWVTDPAHPDGWKYFRYEPDSPGEAWFREPAAAGFSGGQLASGRSRASRSFSGRYRPPCTVRSSLSEKDGASVSSWRLRVGKDWFKDWRNSSQPSRRTPCAR